MLINNLECKVLHVDIETYSPYDLKKVGVYKYVDSPKFKILLISYCLADGSVETFCPDTDKEALAVFRQRVDTAQLIVAHNANFERVCLEKYLDILPDYKNWRCTAVAASALGLPRSLGQACQALGLAEQKKPGAALIRKFCTGANAPVIDKGSADWAEFVAYNRQDVKAEVALFKALLEIDSEIFSASTLWSEYIEDQLINECGIAIDMRLVDNALLVAESEAQEAGKEAEKLGVVNPRSIKELKTRLAELGVELESLDKKALKTLAESDDAEVVKLANLRLITNKSSLSKYRALKNIAVYDSRAGAYLAKGTLLFFGARTGRWAGRLFQPQNLPKNKLPDLAEARELLKDDPKLFSQTYPAGATLSELIRTAIIPHFKDTKLIIADYSAIEVRVLAWLAGESWLQDVFNGDGRIYEATASKMFKVSIDSVTKGSDYRAKAKIAVLACGYGGGVGALRAMGSTLTALEMQSLVTSWRNANQNIVKFWHDTEHLAERAINNPNTEYKLGYLSFVRTGDMLRIYLPSGRYIAYQKPAFVEGQFSYMGVNSTTNKYQRISAWGGKLVENIVQAVARDCLAAAISHFMEPMLSGLSWLRIRFHCHDEIIFEVSEKHAEMLLAYLTKSMGTLHNDNPNKNAAGRYPGLKLAVDAFIADFYQKD